MIFLSRTGCSCSLVHLLSTLVIWSAKIVPSAAYFQATIGGYTFSIPTFNFAEFRNQYNAQNWCNGNQSKLLEIRNNNIQAWTRWFIGYAINEKHMSGSTLITNGKRLNSGLTWVNGIGYNGGLTVDGQASGYSHSYVYIYVTQSGFQFVADTPIVKRSFVCEGSSFCSNGFKASERCYNITRETLSWYDARNQCIDRGGDLASFDFITDNAGFNALNGSGLNPSSTYWIGFTRQNWTWQDSKSEVRYSEWSDGHPYYPDGSNVPAPYKECLCLEPNVPTYDWQWSECDCTQSYQFFCMTGSPTTLTSLAPSLTSGSPFPVSLPTTADLAIQTRPMHSLDIPSSLSNPESTSTAAIANPTSPSSCTLAVSNNSALAVGLGVGLGIGIPTTIIIVILALMIARLKRKLKSFEASRNIPSEGVSMPAKEGSATTYESLTKDGQTTDNRTYEELNTIENSQNTNV